MYTVLTSHTEKVAEYKDLAPALITASFHGMAITDESKRIVWSPPLSDTDCEEIAEWLAEHGDELPHSKHSEVDGHWWVTRRLSIRYDESNMADLSDTPWPPSNEARTAMTGQRHALDCDTCIRQRDELYPSTH